MIERDSRRSGRKLGWVGLGPIVMVCIACSAGDSGSGNGLQSSDEDPQFPGPGSGGGHAGPATGGAPPASSSCGNGVLDPGEMCDGTDIRDTCASATLNARPNGALHCSPSCTLDIDGCQSDTSGGAGAAAGMVGASGGFGGTPPGNGGAPAGGTPSTGGTPNTGDTPPGGDGETGRLVGMTAAHDAARAGHPAGTPIPPLTWSTDLASVAQAYAEQLANNGCNLVHSHNGYGENLAYFGGQMSDPNAVVAAWMSEEACYSYGAFMAGDQCTTACAASGGCGHFTQVLWRNTQRVGCGVADCPGGFHQEIWVCNYDPPGNYVGQLPW